MKRVHNRFDLLDVCLCSAHKQPLVSRLSTLWHISSPRSWCVEFTNVSINFHLFSNASPPHFPSLRSVLPRFFNTLAFCAGHMIFALVYKQQPPHHSVPLLLTRRSSFYRVQHTEREADGIFNSAIAAWASVQSLIPLRNPQTPFAGLRFGCGASIASEKGTEEIPPSLVHNPRCFACLQWPKAHSVTRCSSLSCSPPFSASLLTNLVTALR